MSLVIAENICLQFGTLEVLKNMTFRVSPGDRIGLVGPNGEGKTSLLKVIGGFQEPTTGDIHRRSGLRTGYLPQDTPAPQDKSIHQAMLDVFEPLINMENEMHELSGHLDGNVERIKRYGFLQQEFERQGGYGYRTRIEQVLTGLGFPKDMWDRPLAQLSGGQRTRVCLATLLVAEPDLLLLDEPTNHLDIDSTEWLEAWLKTFRGAIVVVSHDRYLLDHVTDLTWEITFRRLETYRGGYGKFLKLREARIAERLGQWQAQQEYIAKTEEFIRIHMGSQRTNEAKGRRTRLERFMRDEAIDRPQTNKKISVELSAGKRAGDIVLTAKNVAAGYDKPLVEVSDLMITRGDRIAIVGPNGSGKTTLLRTIIGQLKPLEGSINFGANVTVGYLSQTHCELNTKISAVDWVRETAQGISDGKARNLLGSLLISGAEADKPTGNLSGGQRSRVILARLMAIDANLLALDEPTNHLDIPSIEIIQESLQRFDGTVIFVSHDRYLVEALATHVWAIDSRGLKSVRGGWEGYLAWRAKGETTEPVQKDAKPEAAHKPEPKVDRKEQIKLKKRLDKIEIEIEKIELEITRLDEASSGAAIAGAIDTIKKLGIERAKQHDTLAELWKEWEKIGERII